MKTPTISEHAVALFKLEHPFTAAPCDHYPALVLARDSTIDIELRPDSQPTDDEVQGHAQVWWLPRELSGTTLRDLIVHGLPFFTRVAQGRTVADPEALAMVLTEDAEDACLEIDMAIDEARATL